MHYEASSGRSRHGPQGQLKLGEIGSELAMRRSKDIQEEEAYLLQLMYSIVGGKFNEILVIVNICFHMFMHVCYIIFAESICLLLVRLYGLSKRRGV